VGHPGCMRHSFVVLLVFCIPATSGGERPSHEPVLVHRTQRAFVHALRAPPRPPPHTIERVVFDGWRLLLTDRTTGKMRDLIEPTGTIAIPTRRASFLQTRLLGVVGDEERLYALLWTSGRIRDAAPGPLDALEGGRYELRVFRLADGEAMEPPALPVARLPKASPPECAGPGPLLLVEGRLVCFATATQGEG